MLKAYTIKIEGVGPVLIERSQRAKHLNISVRPFSGVRVAVPRGMSFRKVERIVFSRIDWIQRNLAKMKRARQKYDALLSSAPSIEKSAARKKLINRLNELSESFGFSYNRVFIRNQKTLWGSCSSRNNINLNIKLVWLPGELMDYVILHELVHIRIKNHSKAFWNELDRFVFHTINGYLERPQGSRHLRLSGVAKKLSSRLKEYGLGFL